MQPPVSRSMRLRLLCVLCTVACGGIVYNEGSHPAAHRISASRKGPTTAMRLLCNLDRGGVGGDMMTGASAQTSSAARLRAPAPAAVGRQCWARVAAKKGGLGDSSPNCDAQTGLAGPSQTAPAGKARTKAFRARAQTMGPGQIAHKGGSKQAWRCCAARSRFSRERPEPGETGAGQRAQGSTAGGVLPAESDWRCKRGGQNGAGYAAAHSHAETGLRRGARRWPRQGAHGAYPALWLMVQRTMVLKWKRGRGCRGKRIGWVWGGDPAQMQRLALAAGRFAGVLSALRACQGARGKSTHERALHAPLGRGLLARRVGGTFRHTLLQSKQSTIWELRSFAPFARVW
ncbi:MAG: hypothetical protein J3K34DRAFT_437512 [Monoraphidium minutum]|nr:MAG: hypothetical protein J3K34DRAFT_437512 [Monoraphidium minutum]